MRCNVITETYSYVKYGKFSKCCEIMQSFPMPELSKKTSSLTSYLSSLMRRRNAREPATLHLSPMLMKFVSGPIRSGSSPRIFNTRTNTGLHILSPEQQCWMTHRTSRVQRKGSATFDFFAKKAGIVHSVSGCTRGVQVKL